MIYKVINIQEADYGCEELPSGAEVKSLVVLENENGIRISREESDKELLAKGIDIGKYAYIDEHNRINRALRVVAAVICDDMEHPTRIFATRRGYGEFKGGWEFPGGKIEEGETQEQAIIREIEEELETEIVVGDLVDTVEYDYPDFHLSMDCFWCVVASGGLVLKEHEAAKWLTRDTLNSVDWLPADIELIEKLGEQM